MLTTTEREQTKTLIETAAKSAIAILRGLDARFPKGMPEWKEDMEELLALAEAEGAKYLEEIEGLIPEGVINAESIAYEPISTDAH
jgi:hypothetical protein